MATIDRRGIIVGEGVPLPGENVPVRDFATVAAVVAASIDIARISYIRTGGYYAPGDGGGALYAYVSSEPAHAGKIHSADGAWWELSEFIVNPVMFGAGLTSDDYAALQAMHDYCEARSAEHYAHVMQLLDADYYISQTLSLRPTASFNMRLKGTGAVFGGSRIIAKTAFTGTSVIHVEGQLDGTARIMDFEIEHFSIEKETGSPVTIGMEWGTAGKGMVAFGENKVKGVLVLHIKYGHRLTQARLINFDRCHVWIDGISGCIANLIACDDASGFTGDITWNNCQVVLNDAITDGHCFRAETSSNAAQIKGLRFHQCITSGGNPDYAFNAVGDNCAIGDIWITEPQIDGNLVAVKKKVVGIASGVSSQLEDIHIKSAYFRGHLDSCIQFSATGTGRASEIFVEGGFFANMLDTNVMNFFNCLNVTVSGNKFLECDHPTDELVQFSSCVGVQFNFNTAHQVGGAVFGYMARFDASCNQFFACGNIDNGISTISKYGDATVGATRLIMDFGSMAGQLSSAVAITGGTITGITDLAIADGGTGASTASGARTNLGLGTAAVIDTGTSGTKVPLLDGANTWSAAQTFTSAPVFSNQSGSRAALGLGTAATQNTGTSGANVPLLNAANTWASAQTFTAAPVFTDASGSRSALGLGTAATQNTGTSGANVPLLNGANTWSADQVFSGNAQISGRVGLGAGALGGVGLYFAQAITNAAGITAIYMGGMTMTVGSGADVYYHQAGGGTVNTSGATVSQVIGIYLGDTTKAGGGTITNSYALVAPAKSVATNNYGIDVRDPSSHGAAPSMSAHLLIGASTTAKSALRLVVGSAPTSPVDGDIWFESNTNTGIKARINGVTKSFTLA